MADIILLDLESTRDRDTEIEKYNGYCFLGVCVCVCVLLCFSHLLVGAETLGG